MRDDLQRTWLSKIRFCSLPRSMAITTARCVPFSGVITLCGRDVSVMLIFRACLDAYSATHAASFVEAHFLPRRFRYMSRYHGHGFDRASVDALATSITDALVNCRNEIGRVDRMHDGQSPGGDHGLTAAPATIANEVDVSPAHSLRTERGYGHRPAKRSRPSSLIDRA